MRINRLFALSLVIAMAFAHCMNVAAQVGTWKNYMAYNDVQDVKRGGNTLYVLASNDLYTYNENDKSIQTYDKVNGLNDCNITRIEWNNSVKKLLILYSDYNIDMLGADGSITNISDYYNYSTSNSKTVNDIYISGRFAYLSTDFGIVKLDMRDNEISDTYTLRFVVNYCYIDDNYIYAASSTNGLYRASLTSNLLDPGQWSRVGNYTKRTYTPDADLVAEAQTLSPGGPLTNIYGYMTFHNGSLYTVPGGFKPGTSEFFYPGLIQKYDGTNWTRLDEGVADKIDHQYIDLLSIDIDPTDDSHFFACGRTGLFEFRNNQFYQAYDFSNSPLKVASGVRQDNKNYNIVTSVKFDNDGNLWLFNAETENTSLFEITKSGEWINHHSSSFMVRNGSISFPFVVSPIFDNENLLWFANFHYMTPSIVCYQPSTGGSNVYSSFVNEDGENISIVAGVSCISQDYNGNIWLGTDVGPLYIDAASKTTQPSEMVFQQYKVPRNDGTDLADYLLTGISIKCMAIDGANRKWFGTDGNGVYLISADNNTQVYHFLTSNSKLLSDVVNSIAINPTTGEVFFGTDNGLCSFMSDATATVDKMDKDVTYAYPNPVKPGYTGPITITGLTYNADVKIVTSNGALVAEGRSTGGSFVWDGNDLNGKRVASGVYMVQTATESGDKGTVCKIAIVN